MNLQPVGLRFDPLQNLSTKTPRTPLGVLYWLQINQGDDHHTQTNLCHIIHVDDAMGNRVTAAAINALS